MAVQVASLFGTLSLDDKDFQRGLKSADTSMSSTSDRLKDLGKNVLLLSAPFIAFGALAVKSFSDSEQQLAQLDAVLKSTGGAAGVTRDMAIDLASGFQKVTRFSDETIMSAENMLLTFTNLGKNIFPEATKTVLDMSTALGQDTKSSAIQLGKALNDPIDGITALTRVGVKFTQSQKDMITALVKAGKVEEAQAIILKELQTEFGGSAVAAGKTFAGQLDILRNKIDDFMETIGSRLMPIVMALLTGLTTGLGTFFQAIGDGVDPLESLGMAIFSVFGEQSRGLVTFLKSIGDFFEIFIGTMQAGVTPLNAFAAALVDAFGSNETTRGIAGFFYNLQIFINDVAIPAIVRFRDWFIEGFGRVRDFVVTEVLPRLQTFFQWLGDVWENTIKPGLQKLYDWFVTDALPKVKDFVENEVRPALDTVFTWLGGVWEQTIKPGLQKLYDWFMTTALPAVQNFVENTFKPALDTVFGWLGGVWDTVISPGLTKLHDWFVTGGLQEVIKSVQDFFANIGKLPGEIQKWIDKQGPLVRLLEDAIIAIGLLSGLMIIYNVLATAAAAISLAVAAGIGAIKTAVSFLLGPIGLVIIGLTALIALYHEVARLQASYAETQASGVAGINANRISREEYLNRAFAASASQLGDAGARLTWGSTTQGNYQGVGGTAARFYDENVASGAIGQFANGGWMQAGVPGIVGEQGPELFTPSTSGNISTAGDTAQMMGNKTYNLTIYANDYAGGQAAGRGFMDAARAKGW